MHPEEARSGRRWPQGLQQVQARRWEATAGANRPAALLVKQKQRNGGQAEEKKQVCASSCQHLRERECVEREGGCGQRLLLKDRCGAHVPASIFAIPRSSAESCEGREVMPSQERMKSQDTGEDSS